MERDVTPRPRLVPPATARVAHGPEVLLVDDNLDDAELARSALGRVRIGHQLVHVEDGAQALDFLFGPAAAERVARLKFILLDLKLPKVSGLEVLRRVRAEECTRLLPVVVLTSSQERSDIEASYRLGVSSYVVKPIIFTQYMEVVADLGRYWGGINRSPADTH